MGPLSKCKADLRVSAANLVRQSCALLDDSVSQLQYVATLWLTPFI